VINFDFGHLEVMVPFTAIVLTTSPHQRSHHLWAITPKLILSKTPVCRLLLHTSAGITFLFLSMVEEKSKLS
jgi:hypothetical protein